jgi:hypothetical protein
MYISKIPVKLDRNTFRSTTEVGFRPVEKAEHQGCCGRILPENLLEQESCPGFRPKKMERKQECAT